MVDPPAAASRLTEPSLTITKGRLIGRPVDRAPTGAGLQACRRLTDFCAYPRARRVPLADRPGT